MKIAGQLVVAFLLAVWLQVSAFAAPGGAAPTAPAPAAPAAQEEASIEVTVPSGCRLTLG